MIASSREPILLGPSPFAHDAKGQLITRIGTIFLRTPGLVTTRGIHAMQRMEWIDELNRRRREAGKPELTAAETEAELASSVDLLFDEQYALIRPDPRQMALAIRGDEFLQRYISKRRIRYLNIQNKQVRDALRRRGEAWRMAPMPLYEEELRQLIEEARVGIDGRAIYYYNRLTGTRFLTLAAFRSLGALSDNELRSLLIEIQRNLPKRNRFANPEVAFFPVNALRADALEDYDFASMDSVALRKAYNSIGLEFASGVTQPSLTHDNPDNADWRKALSSALIHAPNETGVSAVIEGLSPEFFMQIEWLPGGRVDEGELFFDPIFCEADMHPEDVQLQQLCDHRARGIFFNYLREYSQVEYVNIGRTRRSLSGRTGQGPRASVYIVELKERYRAEPQVKIIRVQRWTVASHLQKGRSLLDSIVDAEDYTDYVMDRRLGARQLGMHLPATMIPRTFRETVTAKDGTVYNVCTGYFERDYIPGRATDKTSDALFASMDFCVGFFRLLGQAAAPNMIIGRAKVDGGDTIFDDGDEVINLNAFGLPESLILSEPTGAFVNYDRPYVETLPAYAAAINRRKDLIPDPALAAQVFVNAFEDELARIQRVYRDRKLGFDMLFRDRPMDTNGSIAYRWKCVLERLNAVNAHALAMNLLDHIDV